MNRTPGRDLDLVLGGDERPLAQRAAVGHPARLAAVEVAQDLMRVEAVGAVVDLAAAKRRVAGRGAMPAVRTGVVGGRRGAAVRVRNRRVQGGRAETDGGNSAQQAATFEMLGHHARSVSSAGTGCGSIGVESIVNIDYGITESRFVICPTKWAT